MKKVKGFVAMLMTGMLIVTGCSAQPTSTTAAGTAAGTTAGTTAAGTSAATTTAGSIAGKGKNGVILGVGGLGDQGYNDLVFAGAKKAQTELGIDFDHAEPKQISEFELIMRDMAQSGEYDVIIGVGFDQVDPMNKVAPEFPEQNFAIIDGVVEQPNVVSYSSKEEEGSFMVGVLAGLMTKNAEAYKLTKTGLGFIGAMEIPLIVKFNAGFQAGAKFVNPGVEVQTGYVSGDSPFSDTSTAKEIALSQNQNGAGIIFHAAGGSGLGLFQAATEGDFYAIGANSNQNGIDPDHIVASMLKRVDTAAFEISKAASIDGNLPVNTQVTLGIKDDGVGYTLENSNVKIQDEHVKILEDLYKKIASGELVIPTKLEEVDSFLAANKFE